MALADADRSAGRPVVESLESRCLLSAVISSVTFAGTVAAPTVTIKGSGFGAKPKAVKALLGTGSDYVKNNFLFRDLTANPLSWTAGTVGNYIGLNVTKFSGKLITFGFGSGLAEEVGNYSFNVGDDFQVGVNGSLAEGSVALDGSNTIPVAAQVTPTILKHAIPATVAAGATLKGSFVLSLGDSGNIATASPLNITVYAVSSASETASFVGQPVLKMLTHNGPLAPGSTHKLTIKFAVAAPAAGQYFVAVVITPAGGVATSDAFAAFTVM